MLGLKAMNDIGLPLPGKVVPGMTEVFPASLSYVVHGHRSDEKSKAFSNPPSVWQGCRSTPTTILEVITHPRVSETDTLYVPKFKEVRSGVVAPFDQL